jgi:hypothetical protein
MWTAVTWAVVGTVETVSVCCFEGGAEVNPEATYRDSALDVAKREGYEEILLPPG